MVVICNIKDSFCLNISVFLIDKGFNLFLSDANIFRIDGESVSTCSYSVLNFIAHRQKNVRNIRAFSIKVCEIMAQFYYSVTGKAVILQ